MQRNGKNYYVYADPANNQIYVGNPSQYQQYQQLRLARNLVQDQLATAELNQQVTMGWGYWDLGDHYGQCGILNDGRVA